MRLLAAELRKLTYQRAIWGMVLGGVLFSVLGTASTPVIIDSTGDGLGFGALTEPAVVDAVYANAVSGFYFSMLLGVLVVAGEFRHGTAVATFVAAPRRKPGSLSQAPRGGDCRVDPPDRGDRDRNCLGLASVAVLPGGRRPFGRYLSQHGNLRCGVRFCLGNCGQQLEPFCALKS